MLYTSDGMQSIYIYDGTPGSMVALITSDAYEAAAYDYDPYGLPTLTATSGGTGEVQNPYGFAGGIRDRTTSWVHHANRYYDPTTGAWTQMDTLDAPLDPGNANRYAYAAGDPINNIDPTGRKTLAECPPTILGATAGGLVVGAITGGLATSPGGPTAIAGAAAGATIGGVTGAIGGGVGCAYEAAIS